MSKMRNCSGSNFRAGVMKCMFTKIFLTCSSRGSGAVASRSSPRLKTSKVTNEVMVKNLRQAVYFTPYGKYISGGTNPQS